LASHYLLEIAAMQAAPASSANAPQPCILFELRNQGTASIRTATTGESVPQFAAHRTAISQVAVLLLLAAAATAVVSPMFFLGNASGHDFEFHLASWLDVAGQWREGIMYPRWAEWANWGFGEPRFIFYPPLSWMLGAGLGTVLPWRIAPGAFIWLALILAGLSMWRLARECLPAPQAAAAAVFFAVNPYHLVIVYYRSDFAELLASALLPLMIWAAQHVLQEGWRRVPALAFIFAAIWLSNAPAAVISTYSLALLLSVGCILRRTARPLIPGATAMAVGLGLAAFYILPAAYEQRWVQIAEVIGQNLRPDQNFLFTHANDPEFVLFNWKVSGVALGVMLIAGIAAVFTARRRREFPELWWMLVALGAVSVLLMFPPALLLWRYLPKLRFVQFPWRWLVPLDVVFAFLVAAAPGRSRREWAWWLALSLVICGLAATIVEDAWWDSEDIPVLTEAIHSEHGYEGTDEYAPLGCDRYSLPGSGQPSTDDVTNQSEQAPVTPTPHIAQFDPDSGSVVAASDVHLRIDKWIAEQKIFTEESSHPVTLALRLVNYPAWEAQVDGASLRPQSQPSTAQLLLPLPPGPHHVEVRFRRTPDRTAGASISALSALALLAAAMATRRRIAAHV
jgi:6-pyruvoyl-tetrahydropterin synthase-like protein